MFQTIKRICLHKAQRTIAFLTLGCLFVGSSCNTRMEGCLDIAAANFDLDADRACADCCTYPSLSFSLSQKWDERNFSTTDTLLDVNGVMYKIVDLKYFLSSWTWRDMDNAVYTVDSTDIACNGTELRYTPDIVMVDSRQFLYTLGTIRQSPLMDSVHLKLGVLTSLDCIDEAAPGTPVVLTDKSPLWDQQTSSRAALRIVLQRDLGVETYDSIYIHTLRDVSLGYDLDFKAGFHTTLNLSVNYALWFSTADINVPGSFEDSFLAGLTGSIVKTP